MNKSFGEFFLSCKECILENPRSFYGSFSLGPFQNSQSLTIANAFRRTLLTEIGGIAITDVQIDGVFHEYSTIEGVRESVLDILLNFKQIVLSTSVKGGQELFTKPMYGYLNVRGPGIVRISDLKLPPTVQYVDPDQYIATLNENGKLCLKVLISDLSSSNTFRFGETSSDIHSASTSLRSAEAGPLFGAKQPVSGEAVASASAAQSGAKQVVRSGIVSQKKGKELFKALNTPFLSVDATFNPILKVNYLVENLQPIQNSRQNQVIHIELWTNGSIHPRNAINLCLTFLKNMFDKFDDMDKISSKISKEFFESDETLVKILKSFEYDFHLYGALEAKKMPGSFFPLSKSTIPRSVWCKAEAQIVDRRVENQQSKNTNSIFFESEGSVSGTGQISLNSSIHVLNLPYRVSECLIRNKVLILEDLVQFRKKEFAQFSGIGHFSVSLIQKKLKKLGFEFQS